MAHGEATKRHPGRIADISSTEKLARMYETDDVNDGYRVLKLYMSKLNQKSESFSFNIQERTGVSTTSGMKRIQSE